MKQPAAPIEGLRLKAAQPPTAFGPGAMLRTADWKLCLYADDQGELYDLKHDRHETRNRYGDRDCATIQDELQRRLVQRMLCRGQGPEELPNERL